MNYLKAFIAGVIIPGILLPAILTLMTILGYGQVVAFMPIHYIPWVWGLWNMLYFVVCKDILPGDMNVRMWITGISLGILVAITGVFYLAIPSLLGLYDIYQYIPLIIVPILYGFIWRYFVKTLNQWFGLAI